MNLIFILFFFTFSIIASNTEYDKLFQERFTLRCFQESTLYDGTDNQELEKFRERIKKETEDELKLYFTAIEKVKVSQEEIDEKLLDLKISYNTTSINEIALKSKKSKDELIKDIKIELYIQKFLKKFLFRDIKVSKEEIEDYYYQHIDQFTEKKKILLYQIFSKSIYDLKEAYKKLENKENFLYVANKYSKLPILVGWVSKKNLPNFFNKAFRLRKGRYTDIVKSDFGYHIFWVKEKRDATYIDIKKVSKKIELIILEKKNQEKLDQFLNK